MWEFPLQAAPQCNNPQGGPVKTKTVLGIVAVVAMLAIVGRMRSPAESDPNLSPVESGPDLPRCQAVGSHLTRDLGVASAMAYPATVPPKPGVARTGAVWFVAAAGGATWVTNISPTQDESGIILPLNEAARQTSEMGTEVRPGVPIFSGIDDGHQGAHDARACLEAAR